MIGRTNAGSSSLSNSSALLHITAVVGSTITLSKNNIVIKILDSNKGHINANDSRLADWYYSISSSNYGDWSIEVDTVTKTINIDTNKQYDIRFDGALWIVKDGYLQGYNIITDTERFTSTENYNNTNSLRLYHVNGGTYEGTHYAFFKPSHDFTTRPYNFLNCELMATDFYSSGSNRLGIGSDTVSTSAVDWPISRTISKTSTKQTVKIDISNLTGSLFFKISIASSNSYYAILYLYNVWLSEE